MIEMNAFAKAVYKNAKAHGFWEPEPDFDTIIALIQSEWSEALEEYRAGRPMVWHLCQRAVEATQANSTNLLICERSPYCYHRQHRMLGDCKDFNPKPEGIAVELIDGVLRILDFAGKFDIDIDREIQRIEENEYKNGNLTTWKDKMRAFTLPQLVVRLHTYTSFAWDNIYLRREQLCHVIIIVFEWIRAQGIDPEDVMREKNAYNCTRPYRHGGKIC